MKDHCHVEQAKTDSQHSEIKSKNDDETCNFFGCAPRCIQPCNTIQCHVFWQCVFNFFQGFIVNGVINVIIPALEKRFKLSSAKSALISSSNDFGAFCLYTLGGYLGEQTHKPRFMASGVFLMAVGGFIFSLPQFTSSLYDYGNQKDNQTELCVDIENNTSCYDDQQSSDDVHYATFLIGQILLGIGAIPMFSVGLTYVDENCKQKMTSFYVALTFCCSAIGVAVGYIVGGLTLTLFVDFNRIDVNSLTINQSDPSWVGAWWIGILIAACTFLVIGIPICAYPRRLPGHEELEKYRKSEVHNDSSIAITADDKFGTSLKDYPKAMFLLIKNPTFVFICIAGTAEAAIIAGLATFGSKLLQEFGNETLSSAGLIMGVLTIVGSGGGMMCGGYLVKRLGLTCRGIIRFCGGSMLLCVAFAPSFLAFCPSPPLMGITEPYRSNQFIQLTSDCNRQCRCTTSSYAPLCDTDAHMYFSPCFAGCASKEKNEYSDCACTGNGTGSDLPNNNNSTILTKGYCGQRCSKLYILGAALLVCMFFTFMTMSPIVAAVFRCVPYKQRSLALATEQLLVRLGGTMPGPILLGAIIDSSCYVWQTKECDKTFGTCWMYNKQELAIRLMIWWAVLKIVGALSYFIADRCYNPVKVESEQDMDKSVDQCKKNKEFAQNHYELSSKL